MKLHNLIITAALFLTAGIASAAPTYNDGNLIIDYENATSLNQNIVYNARTNYWRTTSEEPTYRASISLSVKGNDDFVYELYQVGGTWSKELENTGWQTVQLPVLSTLDGANTTYALRVSDYVTEPNLIFHSVHANYQSAYSYVGNSTVDFTTGSFSNPSDKKAQFIFGSPLPTPVVTLLIALGFGAAFVMYRNRKQVKS